MYDKNSINKAIIVGRCGQDPEIKYTNNNTQIANFSLATQTQGKDKEAKTEWHRCVAFGKLAEIIENYVGKGDQVYVEGKLQTDKFQDKDGNDKQVTKVVVNQLQMLGGSSSNGSSNQSKEDDSQDDSSDLPF